MRKILRQITKIITFIISFLMVYHLIFWVIGYLNLNLEFRYFDRGLEWLKNSEGKYIWSKTGGFFLKNNNPYFYENGKFVFDISSISLGFIIFFFTMQLGYLFWNNLGKVLFINRFKQEVYVIENDSSNNLKNIFKTLNKPKEKNEEEVSERVENEIDIPKEFKFEYIEGDFENKYIFKRTDGDFIGEYKFYAFGILDSSWEIELTEGKFEEIYKIIKTKNLLTNEKNVILEKILKEG